jgi:HK97 family phage major capsid protein
MDYKTTLKDGLIGGYGVRFTGPQDKDLQGDYFTPETNLWLEHYPVVPVLYQHGQDGQLGKRVIGQAVPRRDDVGVWYEAQLSTRDEYESLILELVKAGALGYSTGSLPHLVERASDGKLLSWPVAEITLTPTPAAGPYLTSVSALRSVYKSAGIENQQIEDQQMENQHRGGASMEGQELENKIKSMIEAGLTGLPRGVDEAQVKSLLDARLSALPPALDEAKVKGLIEATIAPYLKPGSDTPPAATAAEKAVKAFDGFLHTGVKTLNTTDEGDLIPQQYYAELITALTEMSILRRAGARVVQMTGNSMIVPTMTHSGAAVLTAELDPYDETEPTTDQIEFTPYKYTRLTRVSEELVADSLFDIWGGVLSPDFAQAFAAAENAAFTTGNGTTAPQGVVTGAGVGVTAASSTAFTTDEVIDTYHSLNYLYRQNATWMMNDATALVLRKMKDGTGQYLWQPGLQAGQPDTLLGRPVITNNSMATVAQGARVILFGDFRYYWIGQRAGMTVDRNPYLYMANGMVGFFARMRVDAHVMLADAFKVLRMKP